MRGLTALLLASALLAGCSGGGGDEEPLPPANFEELDLAPTATTGVIRGVVVDEAIRPIPGASLVVQTTAGERSTESNDEGAFGFDGLQPGPYFIQATKPGYTSAQSSAEVVAGVAEPPIVKVLLVADPELRPFFESYTWEGFIECSARYFIEGRNLCAVADAAGQVTNDDTVFDVELASGIPTYAQGELVWESTQTLGDELSFNWRRDDTSADYIDTEGPSPLLLAADYDLFEENEVGAGQPLRTIVFTAHNQATEPPAGGLWGVGVQVQQKFTMYLHVFYNFQPDEGWRFSVDGDPVVPT